MVVVTCKEKKSSTSSMTMVSCRNKDIVVFVKAVVMLSDVVVA